MVIFVSTATADAAAKSLQSCLTLCNPIDGGPPGSPVPGILQARILEWVAISFPQAMLSKSLIQFSVDGWSYVPSLLFSWAKLWWRE